MNGLCSLTYTIWCDSKNEGGGRGWSALTFLVKQPSKLPFICFPFCNGKYPTIGNGTEDIITVCLEVNSSD